MDTVDALRLVAMRAVQRGDGSYNLRFILRWYSKTFYTPLPVVEELPIEDVLQTYFETRYEEMSEDERHQEMVRLLETEEEQRLRRVAEDAADAEAVEFAKFTEKQIQKKESAKKPMEKAAAAVDKLASSFQKMAAAMPDEIRGVGPEPEAKTPPPKILPDIKMTFLEPVDFNDLMDGSFGPKDPKSTG